MLRQIRATPLGGYRTLMTVENGGRDHVYRIHGLPTLPRHWPYLLGDLLHNCRAALDNSAYEFASRLHNPMPRKIESNVKFPIAVDEKTWRDLEQALAEQCGQNFRDYARSVQPLGDHHSPHWYLEALRKLNNQDKPHAVTVAFTAINTTQVVRPGPEVASVSVTLWGEITEGSEVYRIRFYRPRLQPYFDPKPTLTLALKDHGPFEDLVQGVSRKVIEVVEGAPWPAQ